MFEAALPIADEIVIDADLNITTTSATTTLALDVIYKAIRSVSRLAPTPSHTYLVTLFRTLTRGACKLPAFGRAMALEGVVGRVQADVAAAPLTTACRETTAASLKKLWEAVRQDGVCRVG